MIKKLLIVAAFVLPLLPLAIYFVGSGQSTPNAAAAARAERLPLLNAAQLGQMSAGAEVMLEGQISEQSIVKYRSFVSYVKETHYIDNDLISDIWYPEQARQVPFDLKLADGTVHIINESYRTENPVTVWIQPGNTGSNPTRYTGFAIGDPVTVIGYVTVGSRGRTMYAEILSGGTRADYIVSHRWAAMSSTLWLSIGLAVLAVLGVSLYFMRKQMRPSATAAV